MQMAALQVTRGTTSSWSPIRDLKPTISRTPLRDDTPCSALVTMVGKEYRAVAPPDQPLWIALHSALGLCADDDWPHGPVIKAWYLDCWRDRRDVAVSDACRVGRIHFGSWKNDVYRVPPRPLHAAPRRETFPVAWCSIGALPGVASRFLVCLLWAPLGGWGRIYKVDENLAVQHLTSVWVA